LHIRTDYDYTALMAAARNGHENIVKTLVEKGAEVDLKDNEGMSAIILAAQYGHYEIVKFLIPRVANINEKASVVTVKKGKAVEGLGTL
jgi:ankyrin repeat protein